MKHKTSLKAKVVFFFIPVLFLILVEFVYSIINNTEAKSGILGSQNPPPVVDIPLLYNQNDLDSNFFLQTTIPQPELPFHRPDPQRYWKLRPWSSFTFKIPGQYIINYSINSAGFRGNEIQLDKPKGKFRIICAGDSSTFGFYLNLSDTYPYRLERMLETQTKEKNAEVINAGVWCYSSYQGRISIENDLIDLHPDILLFSYGFNDSQLMDYPDSFKKNLKNQTGFHKNLEKLISYKCIKKLMGNFEAKQGLLFETEAELVPRVALTEYRENLETVVSLCQKAGIKLIFLPISVPIPYTNIMREIAKEKGILYIDIEEKLKICYDRFFKDGSTQYKDIYFKEITKRPPDKTFIDKFGSKEMYRVREWNYVYMDFCHPTPAGNLIIAEEIFETLLKEGFFNKSERVVPPTPPNIVVIDTPI